MKSINPYTGELIKEVRKHSSKTVDKKIGIAQNAFDIWRRESIGIRIKHIQNVAQILRDDLNHYAELATQEMGKTIKEAKAEVEKCAVLCDYYAENATKFLQDEEVKTEAIHSFIAYEPLGIILGVMPWNYPYWQVFRFAVPALLAGNVCLLKHASNVSLCSLALEDIFTRALLPEGAFQSLLIESKAVKKVIADERIKGVALTGSEPAGSHVASQAGGLIKKTVLELGGSDPFIVLEDANLKESVEWAMKSRLVNGGQSCIAAKRFIVHESIALDFTKLLKEEFEKLVVGDPMKESTQIGPMARIDLVIELMHQVEVTVAAGAKVESGKIIEKPISAIVEPIILTGVKPGMATFDEEVFGPVASITEFKRDEEAVDLANQSRYGLGSSIWTSDNDKGVRLARMIQSGTVYINGMMKSDPRLPFGGIKKSGYGRELGMHGIHEFCNVKSIVVS